MKQFKLKNARIINSVDEMSSSEKRQWTRYLRQIDMWTEDNIDDFFNPDLDKDYVVDELWIYEWEWNPTSEERHKLVDIFGWPGDNQDGGIFFSNHTNPIFLNGDTDIVPNSNNNKIDPRLIKLIRDFGHIRLLQKHEKESESCSNYKWCKRNWELRDEFLKRND